MPYDQSRHGMFHRMMRMPPENSELNAAGFDRSGTIGEYVTTEDGQVFMTTNGHVLGGEIMREPFPQDILGGVVVQPSDQDHHLAK